VGSPLYYSCKAGLAGATNLLLEEGADVNSKGGQYGFPLQAACYNGHLALVRLLLDNGADINLQGGVYDNALQGAGANSAFVAGQGCQR
jgi:ankyrin repeat protein